MADAPDIRPLYLSKHAMTIGDVEVVKLSSTEINLKFHFFDEAWAEVHNGIDVERISIGPYSVDF